MKKPTLSKSHAFRGSGADDAPRTPAMDRCAFSPSPRSSLSAPRSLDPQASPAPRKRPRRRPRGGRGRGAALLYPVLANASGAREPHAQSLALSLPLSVSNFRRLVLRRLSPNLDATALRERTWSFSIGMGPHSISWAWISAAGATFSCITAADILKALSKREGSRSS